MNQVLAELKELYNSYQPLWLEWLRSGDSGLCADDLYALSVHVKNNFEITIESHAEQYTKVSVIRGLVLKLKFKNKAFKEWVINRFTNCLLFRAVRYGFKAFFTTPIEKLFISAKLKHGLLHYKVNTVTEILVLLEKKNFKRQAAFEKAIQCLPILLKEERKLLKGKMEVIKEI